MNNEEYYQKFEDKFRSLGMNYRVVRPYFKELIDELVGDCDTLACADHLTDE